MGTTRTVPERGAERRAAEPKPAATKPKPAAAAAMPPLTEAPADNLPATRPRTAVNAIIPTTWQEVTAIAGAICRSGMAPKNYLDAQGNALPDKVAVAIMHGLEVGFTPMAALQSIAVINGMPSIYGDGILALLLASGLLEDYEESVEWNKEGNPVAGHCKMWRRGMKTPSTMTYTIDDAQRAGLWGKQGPWTQHPQRMFQMRARGWCARDRFADVLKGLRIAEEVLDMVDVTPPGPGHNNPPVSPTEPKVEDFVDKKGADQPGPEPGVEEAQQQGARPGVTDAEVLEDLPSGPAADAWPDEEQPEPEPITFEDYKTARAFFDFSDEWLEAPERTPAEARLWEEHYRAKLKEFATHEFPRVREAVATTIGLYSAVLAKEPAGAK